MDKPFLAWDHIAEYGNEITCFAAYFNIVLLGDSQGKIAVLNHFNFTLSPDPIDRIFHIKSSTYAISQKSSSIIELDLPSSSYTLQSSLKLKIHGFSDGYYWSRLSVHNDCFEEIYTIDSKEGEIVQVSKTSAGFLVSSLTRTVLVLKEKVIQIGKKERNGWFGACELSNSLFASRPLGNLWQANYEGIVMITTSYKINAEKITLSELHPLKKFLISISRDRSDFLLIDPIKKCLIHHESPQPNVFLYFSPSDACIFKLHQNNLYRSKIISCYDHYLSLLKGSLAETITFVLENPELNDLKILEPLCVKVFAQDAVLAEPLTLKFCEVIKVLEENLAFPRIEVKDENWKQDALFEEFLKVTTLESPRSANKPRLDKRVRNYYRKDFTHFLIIHLLLFKILLKNSELRSIQSLIRICRKSLDLPKLTLLYTEETEAIDSLTSIL